MTQRVAIVGGGAFGRGLATAATRNGADAVLWTRRAIAEDGLRTTTSFDEVARATLVLLAVPSVTVATVAEELSPRLDGSHLLVHVSRGLIGEELTTLTQVLRSKTPCRRLGALGGPLLAKSLLEGTPAGAIVGSRFPEVGSATRRVLSSSSLRLYETEDVIGVEVASATVGLLAVAAGFAAGLGFGPAALAVLLTRGLAEAARVGVALGGDARTFAGLAGTGDLLAAIAGDERPEVLLGRSLARGERPREAASAVGANVEGVEVARLVASYARRIGVDAPIADGIARVLDGEITPAEAIARLMTRRVHRE